MSDKRISQLVERVTIANNDVLPIVALNAATTNKVTISTIQDWMQTNLNMGVTSVAITLPTGLSVTGSPITSTGTFAISFTAGYSIPTTAKQTEWDTAYTNRITSATAPLGIASNVISITQSGAASDGYLSSTDWNTFNNKQSTITTGNLTEATSSVLTITGGTGAVLGSGTSIQVKQASGSQDGFLDSADWTTFNDKQNALSGTGIVKSTGGTISYLTDNTSNWDSAYNDKINSASVTGTTTKTLTLTQQDGGTITTTWTDLDTGTVTSVGVSMPSAFSVANSPITSSGTIAITGAGTISQYIDGTGALRTFPTIIAETTRLVREVYNNSGTTMAKGTVVYINGGQGNLPTIARALATGDATSAQTYGVVQTSIGNMSNGYIVVVGDLIDMDTQAFVEGTQLYLSPITAGEYTSTKPYAPQHLVYVGIVTRSHPTQGIIAIKIQNGFEMDELHNVSAQNPNNNDILQYKTATNLWTKVAGSTTNIEEGTRLYYTDARARAAFSESVTGLDYNSSTGVLSTTTGYAIPTAASQTNWDAAYNDKINSAAVTGTTTKTLTLNQQDGGTITASWTDINTDAVSSVFGRTGAVVATNGDYNTDQVTEGTSSLYFTNARSRSSISLTTTGTSGAATYNSTTGVFNIPNYAPDLSGYVTIGTSQTITGAKTFSSVVNVLFNSVSEPYINARFGNNSTNGIGGILVSGEYQSHIRFLTGSQTWDGAGAKQWQIRVGNGTGQDNFKIYSWTKGNDTMTILNNGDTTIHGTIAASNLSGTNTGDQTLAGLGGQAQLNGTGFVKASGTTISYDNTDYLPLTAGLTKKLTGDLYVQSNEPNIYLEKTGTDAGTWRILGSTGGNLRRFRIYDQEEGVDRFIIHKSDGNISIGNTTNSGYRLDVSGQGRYTHGGANTLILKGGARSLSFNIDGTATGDFGVALRADSSSYISISAGGGTTTGLAVDFNNNLGIRNAAHESWTSSAIVLQLGATATIYNDGFNNTLVANNSYYNGSNNIYLTTGFASRILMDKSAGIMYFQTAPSGTAAGAVTYTTAIQVNNNRSILLSNLSGTGTRMVVASSDGTLSTQSLASGSIGGSGDANYIPKFTASTTIGNSIIQDNATHIDIGGYAFFRRGGKFLIVNSNYNIANGYADIASDSSMGLSLSANGGTQQLYINTSSNIGIKTASPVTTNLTGSMTIVKSYNGDTPTSTTAQTYDINQSNLYLFGRNAGLTMVGNNGEEAVIAFANASSYYIGAIRYDMGSGAAGGDMKFQTGGTNERMRIGSDGLFTYYTPGQPPVLHGLYANQVLKTDSSGNYQRIRFDVGSQPYWGLTKEGSTNNFIISGYIGTSWTDNNFKIFQATGNLVLNGNGNDYGKRLQVFGDLGVGGLTYNWLVSNVNDVNWGFGMFNSGETYYPSVYFAASVGDGNNRGFRVRNVTTNTNVLFVNSVGTLTASGDVVAFSDIRFKENIRPIDNVLNRIGESRGVLYDRKDTGLKNNIGFIAQELELQFPELVNTDDDGIKSVKYSNAVAVLFEAIKEQQKQIDKLKKQVA